MEFRGQRSGSSSKCLYLLSHLTGIGPQLLPIYSYFWKGSHCVGSCSQPGTHCAPPGWLPSCLNPGSQCLDHRCMALHSFWLCFVGVFVCGFFFFLTTVWNSRPTCGKWVIWGENLAYRQNRKSLGQSVEQQRRAKLCCPRPCFWEAPFPTPRMCRSLVNGKGNNSNASEASLLVLKQSPQYLNLLWAVLGSLFLLTLSLGTLAFDGRTLHFSLLHTWRLTPLKSWLGAIALQETRF